MLGKLLNHSINNNKVVLNYEKKECTVTVVNENVINFFVPLFREERNSKAVEKDLDNNVE